jgi:hypothetical protein
VSLDVNHGKQERVAADNSQHDKQEQPRAESHILYLEYSGTIADADYPDGQLKEWFGWVLLLGLDAKMWVCDAEVQGIEEDAKEGVRLLICARPWIFLQEEGGIVNTVIW